MGKHSAPEGRGGRTGYQGDERGRDAEPPPADTPGTGRRRRAGAGESGEADGGHPTSPPDAEAGAERVVESPPAAGGARRSGEPVPAPGEPSGQGRRPPLVRPSGQHERVRGGHPEPREAGGGRAGVEADGPDEPATATPRSGPLSAPGEVPGPRQEYLDAFADEVYGRAGAVADEAGRREQKGRATPAEQPAATVAAPAAGPPAGPTADAGVTHDEEASPGDRTGVPAAPIPDPSRAGAAGGGVDQPAAPPAAGQPRGGKGRVVVGVAAAAVTTALAVLVAGQVADGDTGGKQADTEAGRPRQEARDRHGASRSDGRPTPDNSATPASYAARMATPFPLDADLRASGSFSTVAGHDRAPRAGERLLRYRVDVEKGLPLDGKLFARAVQKTLNDDRSWAHGGQRAFERVSSGHADFVISLASPGTTATWCAKSGLDTTEDNVSCDSAATERVMINAFRWARGAKTFGDDRMYAYRRMLINHEVGHRLGFNHESCPRDGALAPVMMQQTKFLTMDGVTCKPNAWPHPKS